MCKKLKRLGVRGTIPIVVVLYILIFASLAVTLEISLLQRVEGKRYAVRNNGIYTADALMDIYIYNAGSWLTAHGLNFVRSPGFSEDTYQDFYNGQIATLQDGLTKTVGEDFVLDMPNILTMVTNLKVNPTNIRDDIVEIMDDQVQMSNTILDPSLFRIDWDNKENDIHFDRSEDPDILYLRPIRFRFKCYYKSYTVEKVVTIHGLKFVVNPIGTTQYSLKVSAEDLQYIVEEYNCFE